VEAFEKLFVEGVYVIAVNMTRSTINDAYTFRKTIEEEINSGHTDLIIDLSKCDYVDSTFFGGIIWALGKLTDIGKKLKMVKPGHPKQDIFITTNTQELFELYKTRVDAINSFGEDINTES